GAKEDEVDYQAGFPWPTVGDAPGYSIELIHPGLDNDLGGSWRASAGVGGPGATTNTLISTGETWRYVRGTNEASAPTTLWRSLDFDDTNWGTGALPIGYDPALPMGTPLNDMSGKYSTVFLRKKIVVADASIYSSAFLEALYDDGFKVWINGTNVLNANMATNEVPYYGTSSSTREDNSFTTLNLPAPAGYLVTGTNIIAVQLANTLLSGSSDCFLDLRLKVRTGASGSGPTPGRLNSVYATNAPPQIRQVEHSPSQPKAGEVVTVTAKVTDPNGVRNVVLEYQVVDPGSYIELTDAAYATNWISLPMRDTGMEGDLVAGDDVYSVELPPSIQTHRRLIRYRLIATDLLGASVRVPYADDPQPNFAYFVYNGIPEWRGALWPGAAGASGVVLTYSSNEMARLQPVQLIARSNTVATATWFSRYTGDAYLWAGTLVYDGKVYDHVHYRARGGVWRYAMTKNMWKFDLNRGHELEARDNWGRKLKTPWKKLNLGACIQQGDYGHRGEQGMFESIGSRLFELAGVAAFQTALATFRVVDDAVENPPANQYESDFWGLYLMVEQDDGHFLDEH
ncbi:MAG TPA: hypothetical protein VNT26_24280, partial [Candidatus Sulfotelmatobacter sp.]|nr:hypothetical protein [Candidatus Sulfotelmatobacter sp.]